jgi:hypothetical protein
MKRATKSQFPAASGNAQAIADEYFSLAGLGAAIGKTRRTLARWHVERIGPPRTMCGKTPLYRKSSVFAWLASQEEQPVSRPRRRA